MFLILNSLNLISDISQHIVYVRRQSNGHIIRCAKEEATAVYSINTDRDYSLERNSDFDEKYTLAEVDEIPPNVVAGYYFYRNGEFYITNEKQAELARMQASNDALAMIVDQEYRLMLLELGVQ